MSCRMLPRAPSPVAPEDRDDLTIWIQRVRFTCPVCGTKPIEGGVCSRCGAWKKGDHEVDRVSNPAGRSKNLIASAHIAAPAVEYCAAIHVFAPSPPRLPADGVCFQDPAPPDVGERRASLPGSQGRTSPLVASCAYDHPRVAGERLFTAASSRRGATPHDPHLHRPRPSPWPERSPAERPRSLP